jgi:hypothetical protein
MYTSKANVRMYEAGASFPMMTSALTRGHLALSKCRECSSQDRQRQSKTFWIVFNVNKSIMLLLGTNRLSGGISGVSGTAKLYITRPSAVQGVSRPLLMDMESREVEEDGTHSGVVV